ncbi:CLUMA_CG008154, isoform A [Clunio marinus]|uniref:CLUMA_CG008154, isoform A n=1 Tax=Clunio marinus TaxID=568069 RepID=A0A1J1I6S9_9DIPT|nr:CLUMA_CG008154, isoform A [Clunio marinus]
MNFINEKKLQDVNGAFNALRAKKFRRNLYSVVCLHTQGYMVIGSFFIFPIIELIFYGTYRFPQPSYVPLDFASLPLIIFLTCYVISCFATLASGVNVVATTLYVNTILEYLSVEFKILGLAFEKVFDEHDNEKAVSEFKKLIDHHQKLLSTARKIKNLLSFPLFYQMITAGIILSTSAYEIYSVDNLMSIKFVARLNYALYVIIDLLIASSASENILLESKNIKDKIFNSGWLNIVQEKKNRLLFQLSVQLSYQPIVITAMGFFKPSYSTLLDVMK